MQMRQTMCPEDYVYIHVLVGVPHQDKLFRLLLKLFDSVCNGVFDWLEQSISYLNKMVCLLATPLLSYDVQKTQQRQKNAGTSSTVIGSQQCRGCDAT